MACNGEGSKAGASGTESCEAGPEQLAESSSTTRIQAMKELMANIPRSSPGFNQLPVPLTGNSYASQIQAPVLPTTQTGPE